MSLMQPSELWKMAVDDSVLKSESSQKGKDKDKGKGKTKRSTLRSCTPFPKTTTDPCLKIRLNKWMLRKKIKSPAGAEAKIKHVESIRQRIESRPRNGKGRSRAKREATPNHKRGRARTKKELWKGQASERSAFPRKGKRQRQKQERFHRWRIQQRMEKCTSRQSLSHKRGRHTRCFEHLVAEAGLSCLYSCHQWHRVEEAVYFGLHTSRSVCKLNSRQAPYTVARRLVGWKAQCQTPFQRQRTTRSGPSLPKPCATLRTS